MTPIFQTSTFAQPEVGAQQAFEYSRTGNPTRTALETCLADLEGTAYGAAFASGLAAEDAVFRCLEPGDHVIIGNELYGGTYRLLDQVHSLIGLEFTPVALYDPDSIQAAWRASTRMVWMETPSNPQLHVTDIASVAEMAHRRNALVVVDNTFATPYLQRPVAHGADVVVHSTTKYLSGHSDVVGGFVGTSNEAVAEKDRLPPERHRGGPGAVRLLPRSAGHQDVGRSHGQTLRERRRRGRCSGRPPCRRTSLLPRSRQSHRACHGQDPDAGLRRHGLLHRARRRVGSHRRCQLDPDLHAGRVTRRRRVAHRPSHTG